MPRRNPHTEAARRRRAGPHGKAGRPAPPMPDYDEYEDTMKVTEIEEQMEGQDPADRVRVLRAIRHLESLSVDDQDAAIFAATWIFARRVAKTVEPGSKQTLIDGAEVSLPGGAHGRMTIQLEVEPYLQFRVVNRP